MRLGLICACVSHSKTPTYSTCSYSVGTSRALTPHPYFEAAGTESGIGVDRDGNRAPTYTCGTVGTAAHFSGNTRIGVRKSESRNVQHVLLDVASDPSLLLQRERLQPDLLDARQDFFNL